MINKPFSLNIKLILTISFTLSFVFNWHAKAQLINPTISQMFYNRYLANPAMAGFGKKESYQAFAAYAGQLQAIPGSPSYKLFTIDYGSTGNTGIGINIMQENAGLLVNSRVIGTYSYKIPFDNTDNNQLRLGISFGLNRSRLDLNRVIGDLNDVVITNYNSRENFIDGDFGFGYINNGFSLEGSVYNLRRKFDKSVNRVDYGLSSNYSLFYIALGKDFKIGEEIEANSRVVLRGIHNYKNIMDVGFNVKHQEWPLSAQIVYHSNRSTSLGISIGNNPKNLFYFLYSTPSNQISPFNRGSFEVGFKFSGSLKDE